MVILADLLIIFGLSVLVLFIFNRFGIPSIIGFLITGILIGPNVMGLIEAESEIRMLADIGLVLLLFTIGIEFSLSHLMKMKRVVLIGGFTQVFLTTLAGFLISLAWNIPKSEALVAGFLLAMSSTAVVLKSLQQRAEVESPYGKTSIGIELFQDMSSIPMLMVLPILAGIHGQDLLPIGIQMGKAGLILVLTYLAANYLVPRILYQAARLKDQELFLLCVVLIGFGVAWLTSISGLSLALGAFVAGLVISESDYSQRALSNLLPFRDVFMSFFFVSIGMLLDVDYISQYPFTLLGCSVAVYFVKGILAGIAGFATGLPLKHSIQVGMALGALGEFGLILAHEALVLKILETNIYQLYLAATVLTIMVNPFAIALAPGIAGWLEKLPFPESLKRGLQFTQEDPDPALENHLIIVGFGLNGRNLARAAETAHIAYTVIEMNPETIRSERAKGTPIRYGDSTQEAVLEAAHIHKARVMVVAISDMAATRRVVETARRLNPVLYIIARTRFITEMGPLLDMGADEVIPEEFETSVEIFTRVMTKFFVPQEDIEKLIMEIRSDNYRMLRTPSRQITSLDDFQPKLGQLEILTHRVSGGSTAAGKSLEELALRRKHGVTILAIQRDKQIISNPAGNEVLIEADIVYLMGTLEQLSGVSHLFRESW